MSKPLGSVNIHGEDYQVILLDYQDGEWEGFYEVRDCHGNVMATSMTEALAVKGAISEVEYREWEVEQAIKYILGDSNESA